VLRVIVFFSNVPTVVAAPIRRHGDGFWPFIEVNDVAEHLLVIQPSHFRTKMNLSVENASLTDPVELRVEAIRGGYTDVPLNLLRGQHVDSAPLIIPPNSRVPYRQNNYDAPWTGYHVRKQITSGLSMISLVETYDL
jgi:hypothetical protein